MAWKFNKTIHAVPFDGDVLITNKELQRVNWPDLTEVDGQVFFRNIPVSEGDYIVGDLSNLHEDLRTLVYSEQDFHEKFIWCERAQPGEEIVQYFLFWECMEFSDKVEALIHFDILHVGEDLKVHFTSTNPYNLTPICIPVSKVQIEEIFEWWRRDRLLGSVAWITNEVGMLPDEYYLEKLEEHGYEVNDGSLGPYSEALFNERMTELQNPY